MALEVLVVEAEVARLVTVVEAVDLARMEQGILVVQTVVVQVAPTAVLNYSH